MDLEKEFSNVTPAMEATASELATKIVFDDDLVTQKAKELKELKFQLTTDKEQLADLLIQANLDSIKLKNGLTPKVKHNREFYKQKGVTDDDLFAWLEARNLEHIIKRKVHPATLTKAMGDYKDGGGECPEAMFNVLNKRTVTLYNKSKFLARGRANGS